MSFKPLTKDFLEKVYCKDGLSTWAIEARYGFSRSRVYSALVRFSLPRRTPAQSHVLYARSNFSGDELEKAYLIGFAEGDLRVRNHGGERSETISIACGSTKNAQINLIRTLFSRYGRVWIGKPNSRGVINVEAFVNKSFSFVLPNQREYTWCAASQKSFFSFLAGFTDAEGSLFISDNKAHIAWGNEDRAILNFIRSSLMSFGITPSKLVCDSRAGSYGSHGYVFNKNYCHVECIRKESVRDLLRSLAPYIRHADKKVAIAKIRRNLVARGMMV